MHCRVLWTEWIWRRRGEEGGKYPRVLKGLGLEKEKLKV
jgi:hypothetical protein